MFHAKLTDLNGHVPSTISRFFKKIYAVQFKFHVRFGLYGPEIKFALQGSEKITTRYSI
jgi:hypothetical protein